MKKRIFLHLTAFAALMPCVLLFNSNENIWVNALGFIYVAYLFLAWNESKRVRKFFRDYYREILRIERMML